MLSGWKRLFPRGGKRRKRHGMYPARRSVSKRVIPMAPPMARPFAGLERGISYFGFSQRGESHIRSGKPCQDRCCFARVQGSGILIFAAADGLGSCDHSDRGAYTAVHAAADYLEDALSLRKASLNDAGAGKLLRQTMQAACRAVERYAAREQMPVWAYQSTLTVALYDGRALYFAHAGDDGIVALTKTGVLALATVRHKGEEASSVYPLQNKSTWQFGKVENTAAFILATDGVLDAFVGSEMEGNRVYYPFLEPVLTKPIRDEADVRQLCRDFYDYMKSEPYRQRVTDDLTFIAVCNQNAVHQCLPQFDLQTWEAETIAYEARRRAALYPSKTDTMEEEAL